MPVASPLLLLAAALTILLVAVGLWAWLRGRHRHSVAHTEARSQTAAPIAPRQAIGVMEAPPVELPPSEPSGPAAFKAEAPPPGPVAALMTYTKADGSTSQRRLQICSRNVSGGVFRSLNCRMEGERIVKTFLLSGISRLEVPQLEPPLLLTGSAEIRAWLERHIPERQAKPPGRRQAQLHEDEGIAGSAASVSPPMAPPPPPPLLLQVVPSVMPSPSAALAPSPQRSAADATSTGPAAVTAPLEPPQARPLPSLLPDGARGFAVLDLETTGRGRSCRIVEIALVRLDPQGRITEEWETLVQPGIPIPNADIHGIDDALVQGAPRFAQIAALLAAKLHEHVLVAHNLHNFDGPILEAHFMEVEGLELNLGKGVDTMPRPMLKLAELCSRHGVELDPDRAHTALGDTRALARALQRGMAHLSPADQMVVVQRNGLLDQPCRPVTRAMAVSNRPRSGWIPMELQLEVGQLYYTTGPQSTAKNTEINRAEAHGIRLGLTYRKVSRISLKSPPVFLLSTSLELQTSKMATARERQIPVVLCRDLMQARAGAIVRAWVHQPEGG